MKMDKGGQGVKASYTWRNGLRLLDLVKARVFCQDLNPQQLLVVSQLNKNESVSFFMFPDQISMLKTCRWQIHDILQQVIGRKIGDLS